MKKFTVLFSILMLAALVLSACGAGGNNNNGNATPVVGTQAVGTQGVGTSVVNTPAVVSTSTAAVAVEPTNAVVSTATPAANMAATASPAANTTGTPAANVPVTGNDNAGKCRVMTFHNLLDYDVVDPQGNKIGEVDGIVVLRDVAVAALPKPGADNMAATVTPAAGATAAAPAEESELPAFGRNAQPQIAYLVVDFNNDFVSGSNAAVTPAAGATAATGATAAVTPAAGTTAAVTPAAGTTDTATTPTVTGATPTVTGGGLAGGSNTTGNNAGAGSNSSGASGNSVLVPFKAFQGLSKAAGAANATAVKDDNCVLTLAVTGDVLSQAPRVDIDNLAGMGEDWNAELTPFWAKQNQVIPQSAANGAALGAPVVFRSDFSAVKAVNTNGDDLGEVSNFIFDPVVGSLRYAILQAGGFLGIGEKHVPIPMNYIQWVASPNDTDKDGTLVININKDDWKNAPAYDDDKFDMTTQGWDKPILSYWNGLRAPEVPATTPAP